MCFASKRPSLALSQKCAFLVALCQKKQFPIFWERFINSIWLTLINFTLKFRGEGNIPILIIILSIRTTNFSQTGLWNDIHSPKYQLGFSAVGINIIFKTLNKMVLLILSKKEKREGVISFVFISISVWKNQIPNYKKRKINNPVIWKLGWLAII